MPVPADFSSLLNHNADSIDAAPITIKPDLISWTEAVTEPFIRMLKSMLTVAIPIPILMPTCCAVAEKLLARLIFSGIMLEKLRVLTALTVSTRRNPNLLIMGITTKFIARAPSAPAKVIKHLHEKSATNNKGNLANGGGGAWFVCFGRKGIRERHGDTYKESD